MRTCRICLVEGSQWRTYRLEFMDSWLTVVWFPGNHPLKVHRLKRPESQDSRESTPCSEHVDHNCPKFFFEVNEPYKYCGKPILRHIIYFITINFAISDQFLESSDKRRALDVKFRTVAWRCVWLAVV